MLAGAGLGDDAPLAHAAGEQRLAERVVDLVRAGVREVFALQEDAGAAERLAQAPRFVERRRAPDVIAEQVLELLMERRILPRVEVGALELGDRRDERLGNEAPAVLAVVAARVGIAMAEGRNDGVQAASYDLAAPRRTRAAWFRP